MILTVQIQVGETVQIEPVFSGPSQALTWLVNDITGGDAAVGTIAPAGTTVGGAATYTAPATVPTSRVTITAKNAKGQTLGSVDLTVTALPSPPVPSGTFDASPSSITVGQSATLSWAVQNTTGASIDQGVGPVSPTSGTKAVAPTATTTYTLALTGPGGTSALQASIAVTPAPSPAPSPVTSASIDQYGRLIINDAPVLLVVADKQEPNWWYSAGYTDAQIQAKFAALKAAGFNCCRGNWQLSALGGIQDFQDTLIWNQYGFYWRGSAGLDENGNNAQADFWSGSATVQATITTIVTAKKARPNLVGWELTSELDPDPNNGWGDAGAVPPYSNSSTPLPSYETAVTTVRTADPSRTTIGDLMPTDRWTNGILLPNANGFPLFETGVPGDAIGAQQTTYNAKAAYGKADVMDGLSLELVLELGTDGNGDPSVPYLPSSYAVVRRLYYIMFAWGVRALGLLWGPNERSAPWLNNGDTVWTQPFASGYSYTNPTTGKVTTIDPAYWSRGSQAWNWALQAVQEIVGLGGAGSPVALAPGNPAPLTTTPPYNDSQTISGGFSLPFLGILAVKVTVGNSSYVVAINLQQSCTDGTAATLVDEPVSGATIDIGQTITTLTRLYDADPAPSFSGSVITDDFAAAQVRVYKV